jgi:ferritin
MKHLEYINEWYKEPEIKNIDDIFKQTKTYVDDVFDHVLNIICDVNGISEKAFKKLDDTKEYLEKFFDNNPEILLDIDKMNDKRYQYTGEFIYDKYFNKKIELE